ncbi:hypothetical protein CYMTET_11533 [Cymbomonas tetramitiformis]|uniref:Uncharacterized protein n=1 Tax=Cymbomonas tetramitiformis TaxID=36881 RepID=A0AAE0GMC1_9CHLO|nr:hypothetical protein CYMTET_11533 [Cymbomonas tetramitiformis]
MASRRRSLATIFDNAAASHAATPNTPAAAASPAAGSASHTFVTACKTLLRARFDESVAKYVLKKCMGDKDTLFEGSKLHVGTLFAKIVTTLQACFLAEEPLFASLFALDDAVVVVRVEANQSADWLEESATGAADLLGVRFPANTDPQDGIADFNAALTAARRKNTLDDEEVEGQFIKALDTEFYAPVVSRLLMHDQRAGPLTSRFSALCFVHGEPEMFSAVSACSFTAVGPPVPDILSAYVPHCKPVAADGYAVGGVPGEGMAFNRFQDDAGPAEIGSHFTTNGVRLILLLRHRGSDRRPAVRWCWFSSQLSRGLSVVGVADGAPGTTPPPVGCVDTRPDALPLRRARRHRMRQGFFQLVPVFPPPPGLDSPPSSPHCSPGRVIGE